MPKVTVVMSVYNDADRVERSAHSVLEQTLRDWELVLIDDGSTDGTSDMVDRLAESDDRVRVIHQGNSGLTRALIRGCGEARGPYIARQDADDWSHPDRLAAQAALLDGDPAIGFVSCSTQYVGPEDEPLEAVERPADAAEATRQLLEERQGPPAHGSVMFRKSLYEAVGGYREEFYFGQDSDLWLRMAERSRIAYAPRVLYQARREIESISGVFRPLQREFGILGHECRAARREGRSEAEALERARRLSESIRATRGARPVGRPAAQMAYVIGSRLARDGDCRGAKYLWRVLRAQPWHWRAWVRLAQLAFSRRLRAERQDD